MQVEKLVWLGPKRDTQQREKGLTRGKKRRGAILIEKVVSKKREGRTRETAQEKRDGELGANQRPSFLGQVSNEATKQSSLGVPPMSQSSFSGSLPTTDKSRT